MSEKEYMQCFVFNRTRPATCTVYAQIKSKERFSHECRVTGKITDDPWAHAVRVILDFNFPTAHSLYSGSNEQQP